MATENLKPVLARMKSLYDRKAQMCQFEPGDNVLMLHMTGGFLGPYEAIQKVSEIDYIVNTLDRKKAPQLCLINRLKSYYNREELVMVVQAPNDKVDHASQSLKDDHSNKLSNSEILARLQEQLSNLLVDDRTELIHIIIKYRCIFTDVPRRINIAVHDVDIGNRHEVIVIVNC